MSGGYRLVIAALGGIIILIAFSLGLYVSVFNYSQEERYQRYRYAADKPQEIDPALPRPASAKALEYRAPCDEPKGRDESDLCAQWRAARAAEDSALWAMLGLGIGLAGSALLLWQIKLTREAVEDTSKATDAMRKANEITAIGQRAWVTLTIRPKQIKRSGINGLYFMIDFVAENIGETIATHFSLECDVFFKGQNEDIGDFLIRIKRRIDEFKDEYFSPESSCLIPKDTSIDSFWNSRKGEEINWWRIFEYDAAQPVFLSVAFYRTIHNPEIVQMSWRTWYIGEINDDGQPSTFVKKRTETLRPSQISVDPLRLSMMHEPYRADHKPYVVAETA